MEEFDFFRPRRVEARPVPREGICPVCLEHIPRVSKCRSGNGPWEYLLGPGFVRHHWFEPDGSRWEILICTECNAVLSSNCSIALGDHVFSSWDVQVEYVRTYRERKAVRLRQESLSTKEWCERELSLFRGWLDRRKTVADLRYATVWGLSIEDAEGIVTRRIEGLVARIEELEAKG